MRLINADMLLGVMYKASEREHGVPLSMIKWFMQIIEKAPTVEAKHVVHGEWVEYEVPHIICCSECDWGTGIDEKGFKFCPNCGADMRKKVE